MYVRWQTRTSHARRGKRQPYQHYAAVLVENVRIKGKPTQRHLAYLGGISEAGKTHQYSRRYFWRQANAKLDQLKLTPQQREHITALLASKVVPLTKTEERKMDRERKASVKRLVKIIRRH
jgi:hypothetical protein